jgi:HD-like signal output (HDOD) protein
MSSLDQIEHPSAKRSIYELIGDPKATQLLPSLTIIVKELESLMGKQNVMIDEISSIIRNDQSMAVRVLRMANSAYFAPAQPIVDLDHAVVYLGLNQIRSTILTARCIEKSCNTPKELLDWNDFWTHSVAVGYIMKILSGSVQELDANGEYFYSMGLFHDIGKLALAYLSPSDFILVLELARDRHLPTSSVEAELLGLDHAGLGAWYLQHQGLPSNLVEPIRLHHAWEKVDPQKNKNAVMLSLADRLSHLMGFGKSGGEAELTDPFASREWELYCERCFGTTVDSRFHMAHIMEKLESVEDLIHVTVGASKAAVESPSPVS